MRRVFFQTLWFANVIVLHQLNIFFYTKSIYLLYFTLAVPSTPAFIIFNDGLFGKTGRIDLKLLIKGKKTIRFQPFDIAIPDFLNTKILELLRSISPKATTSHHVQGVSGHSFIWIAFFISRDSIIQDSVNGRCGCSSRLCWIARCKMYLVLD